MFGCFFLIEADAGVFEVIPVVGVGPAADPLRVRSLAVRVSGISDTG